MAPDASDRSGGLYGQGRPRGRPLSFVEPPSEGLSGLPWWVVVDRFRPDRWDIAAAAVCILGVALIMVCAARLTGCQPTGSKGTKRWCSSSSIV